MRLAAVISASLLLHTAFGQEPPTPAVTLNVAEKTLNVNGKNALVYSLTQDNGTRGLTLQQGQTFSVDLNNKLTIPTSVHWHGLILPNNQDGVAFVTQYPIYPNHFYHYEFPLKQTGTYWMHAHYGMEEQRLLAAPLIIKDPEDAKLADQEAVIMLGDFSFKSPEEIYTELRRKGRPMNKMESPGKGMKGMGQDLVDVDYDAFLANQRTLEDPEVIEVKPGTRVRLRIIDAASATNFFIHLGQLSGEAIAVDGNRIAPLKGNTFELSVAQRIDIIVTIPKEGGAFPILAQGEGTRMQTGVILATNGSILPQLSSQADKQAGALTNEQESRLSALHPLEKREVGRKIVVELGGNMQDYIWTLNGQVWPESTPLVIEEGQRVELVFKNKTAMAHPMHLHGHVFQVMEVDGKAFRGAVRDTVLVMPNSTLSIQFDANNPGVWPLHCHILYHQVAGMFTVVRYKEFEQPL